jgi:hypothetical protein
VSKSKKTRGVSAPMSMSEIKYFIQLWGRRYDSTSRSLAEQFYIAYIDRGGKTSYQKIVDGPTFPTPKRLRK